MTQKLPETLRECLPLQGEWTEEAYLRLTDDTNRLVEWTDGYVELLPMPTDHHQTLSRVLFFAFTTHLQRNGGVIRYAPLRIRVGPGKFREPDLLLLLDANDPRRQNRFWLGADLVVEIVSPDKPERDLVDKRFDYAEAGIPEYWIVNPLNQTVTILRLDGDEYGEHGVFGHGQRATSASLPGFAVEITALFDAR